MTIKTESSNSVEPGGLLGDNNLNILYDVVQYAHYGHIAHEDHKRPIPNACYHYKCWNYYSYGRCRWYKAANSWRDRFGLIIERNPVTPGIVHNQVDWNTALSLLKDNAAGLMPRNTSLAVNIAEFASLKSLVPGILRGIGLWPRKGRRWKIRDVAGSHLAYSFGLSPLISDLSHFFGLYGSIREKLKWMKEREGIPTRIYARTSPVTSSTSTSVPPHSNFDTAFEQYNELVSLKTTTVGTLSADATFYLWDDRAAVVRAAVAGLGLNDPVAIAWDLIPCSFVFDWFLPIGRFINTRQFPRDVGSMARQWDLTNFTHSLKSVGEYSHSCDIRYYPSKVPVGATPTPGSMSIDSEIQLYERMNGPPGFSLLPPLAPSFSWSKAALSLSMVAQRVLH